MFAKEAKFSQLLDTLAEHALIKAAVLIDRYGRVKETRGNAKCLKSDGKPPVQTGKKTIRESLYMIEVDDFVLAIIFDENIDFEDIKSDIDELLAQLEIHVEQYDDSDTT